MKGELHHAMLCRQEKKDNSDLCHKRLPVHNREYVCVCLVVVMVTAEAVALGISNSRLSVLSAVTYVCSNKTTSSAGPLDLAVPRGLAPARRRAGSGCSWIGPDPIAPPRPWDGHGCPNCESACFSAEGDGQPSVAACGFDVCSVDDMVALVCLLGRGCWICEG